MSTFRNIEDLTRCLDREKKLLHELFIKRNALSFRYDYALEIADYKADRIRYLIENEVIRESGDYLEMEDIYVQFFEEVLQINEEINISIPNIKYIDNQLVTVIKIQMICKCKYKTI